jgi:hypothetical protein
MFILCFLNVSLQAEAQEQLRLIQERMTQMEALLSKA